MMMSIIKNQYTGRAKMTQNDASHVFVSIPIGSTLVIQQEDGGLWTHGIIVGKGDHNHHNWSYKIQVTTTKRIITHNRQYIKPTSITAEQYMCYHARKHTNIQTDLVDAILNLIKNNPQLYFNKITHNNNNDSLGTHGEHRAKNSSQGSGQEQIKKMEKIANEAGLDNDTIKAVENIVKTRYGRTVRKPDRLMYQ